MAYSDRLADLSREPFNFVALVVDNVITPTATTFESLTDGVSIHAAQYWPCIESIQYAPAKMGKLGGLGALGEVLIKCRDFDWPYGPGTYFGRLLANNPYTLNRVLAINTGFKTNPNSYILSTVSDTQERKYFIKKFLGPDHDGTVTIEAADILSQLKESQIPAVSNGNLNATITAAATGTVNIGSNSGFSASGGYAIIGDEIIAYSGISSTTSIVISARGQGGTTAEAHAEDDPVRNIFYASDNVVNVIRTIIEDFSVIDHATYLPDTDWNTERDTYLTTETAEVWITEPTDLDKVIDELAKQFFISVWWDDVDQEIKLKSLGPTLTTSTAWNDAENILDDKVKIVRDQREIVTQAWIYYGKLNKSGSDSEENYEKLQVSIDADAETDLGQEKITKIFAPYIPRTGSSTASKIATRIISQNSTPIDFTLCVDVKDSAVNVNDPIDVTTDLIQGTDGLPATIKLRVIEKAQLSNDKYRYRMVYSGIEQGNQYAAWAPTYQLSTALTGAAETSVVLKTAIPTDRPSTGTIYVENNNGVFISCSYTSFTGSTYTISSTDFSTTNASVDRQVLIPYDSSGATDKLNYAWYAESDLVGTANDDPYLWI